MNKKNRLSKKAIKKVKKVKMKMNLTHQSILRSEKGICNH